MRRPVELEPGAPSLSAGYLAALPLFLLYEVGLLAHPGSAPRASAERVVAQVLFLFEGRTQIARVVVLLALAALAVRRVRRSTNDRASESPPLMRQIAAGVLAGFLLGPLLLALQTWLAVEPLRLGAALRPTLGASLRLVGAAPWEELLFRVGLYGVVYLLVGQVSVFLGLASRLARFGAELGALLASALLFAWFHLDSAQGLLATGGEPFHRGLFLWRVSAGILLGGLFRWRGLGVAAWAHAVFNLGIALGVRP